MRTHNFKNSSLSYVIRKYIVQESVSRAEEAGRKWFLMVLLVVWSLVICT